MHALMTLPECKPVIVNVDSREFAEMAAAGYIPIKEGTKKKLQEIIQDTFEEDVLDLNDWD